MAESCVQESAKGEGFGMIRVGTSGFEYHDWCPDFYPAGLAHEEYLGAYAARLDCCELNETFFRIPSPGELARFPRSVPEGFRFTVKLHRRLTHERGGDVEMARGFARTLAPLVEAGQLGAVLAQFPFSFVNHPFHRAYLCRLRAALDLPMVAELRNDSWRHPETLDFLRGWGIGWVACDSPVPETSAPPPGMATSRVGYVRFHGRNRLQWWLRDGAPGSRYDYRYRRRELLAWIPRVREAARCTDDVYVIFNNRGGGDAANNAVAFRRMIRTGRKRPASPKRAAADPRDAEVPGPVDGRSRALTP